jgi:sugar phosphate isomerase/epimerase
MGEMKRRLAGEGVAVHDIEFVTVDAGFVPDRLAPMLESARELGAERLSVCGGDPDRSRLIASFAGLCDLAAGFGMGVDLECMAWRQVASSPDAVRVVEAAGKPNGGVLVDALHLSRTGGSPLDLRDVPAALARSAQLCDVIAERPGSTDAIIQEARSGRLAPGEGALPLHDLLAEPPDDATIGVEVPMDGTMPPETHARRVFEATQKLLGDFRRHKPRTRPTGESDR